MPIRLSPQTGLLLPAMLAIALAAWPAAAQQSTPTPPPPTPNQPTSDAAGKLRGINPPPFPMAADKLPVPQLKVPKGFKVDVFMSGIPNARSLRIGDKGTVFVSNRLLDKVYAVAEKGGKRELKTLASGLDRPNGLAFHNGTLYIAEGTKISKLEKIEDNLDNPPKPVVIYDQFPNHQSHGWKYMAVGPDNKLYIQLGQPYNVPAKEKFDTYRKLGIGGIIRMDRDGKNREVYAVGLRNPVGMDFHPKDKSLWTNDNQVDGMGDDQPPGEMNRIANAGQDFGFPWYGGGRTRTTEYKNDTPPANVVFPEVEQAAHAADLGLTFYTGSMFPKKYQGAIFSTQHGSWNRTVPVGARVMVTFLKDDGHAAGKSEPFAEGWNDNGYYLGRPVDVAQLPDGSLLVSDDLVGALYRIWYDGK